MTAFADMDAAEPILGYTTDFEGITFQVSSGGCTSAQSFRPVLRETSPAQLVLNRVKPDFCEAYFPYGTTVKFTWQQLGLRQGSKVVVGNLVREIQVR